MVGFVTFEDFLITATGLRPLAPRRRDRAIASAARYLLDVATEPEPRLAPRDLSAARVYLTPGGQPDASAQEALLASAIELFAARGPASVSVRDIGRHAGVNQGLIYRHFGSKDALLAEALERASSEMFPAALAEEGFDFDAMSWLLHNGATAPRLIARTLVDDVDISTVRRRFPILRRLVDAYDDVPSGAGPADLSDPRVAVVATAAMALGSSIWGEHLRGALGLGVRDGIDVAIADLARVLVLAPFGATDDPRGTAMSDGGDDPLFASSRLRSRVVSIEAAAVAGIVCGIGWSVSLAGLLSAPGIGAPDREMVEYYADSGERHGCVGVVAGARPVDDRVPVVRRGGAGACRGSGAEVVRHGLPRLESVARRVVVLRCHVVGGTRGARRGG